MAEKLPLEPTAVGPRVPLPWWQAFVEADHGDSEYQRYVYRIDNVSRFLLRPVNSHYGLVHSVLNSLNTADKPSLAALRNVDNFLRRIAYSRADGAHAPCSRNAKQ